MMRSSVRPEITSTALPTQPMAMPCSHFSPGSDASGNSSAAFLHEVMAGVPLASM
jgi:hypothetical protein